MALCVDPPPYKAITCTMSPLGNDGHIMEPVPGMTGDPFEVSTELCPRLRAIELASCEELASPSWMAGLLAPMTILRAISSNRDSVNQTTHDFTGLYRPGLVHPPRQLAALLVQLGKSQPAHGALRTVFFNSNNGWTACLAAAYFHRIRAGAPSATPGSGSLGGGFHGLAVNDLKTEWATCRNIRVLLERLNLSWRVTPSFDAAADAALMSYHPHVRNSLTPTAFAHAATLLPVGWTGLAAPYDICIRFGEFDTDAVEQYLRTLAGWCLQIVFYHGRLHGLPDDTRANVTATIADAQVVPPQRTGWSSAATEVGGFSVITISGRRARAPSGDFAFVNKTPPAAADLYAPACIRDLAGCNWHRGVPPAPPGSVETRPSRR